MATRKYATLSLLVSLACSSQKPAGNPGIGAHESGAATGGSSGTATGGSGDAAIQTDADTTGSGGAPSTSDGGVSIAGTSSATGGTANGGASNSTGGLPASTGGTSASPGLPTLCSPKAIPGQPQSIPGISLDAAARFAAVTPDELTLLWTVADTSGVTIYVSDRSDSNTTWGTPQSIIGVPAADNAITVTPDGLEIAYVDESNQTLATINRLDRTSAFTFPDSASGADFAIFNTSTLLSAGDTYAYPLYGPHLTSFYYAVKAANGNLTWYVAGRFESQGAFSTGSTLNFASPPSATAILSGVSDDENTLFFVDASTGQSSWTFFDEVTIEFDAYIALGNFGTVQPNQSCTRLYGNAAPGSIMTLALQ